MGHGEGVGGGGGVGGEAGQSGAKTDCVAGLCQPSGRGLWDVCMSSVFEMRKVAVRWQSHIYMVSHQPPRKVERSSSPEVSGAAASLT